MRDIQFLAASPRTPTSAFVVSMWYIPGGCDYANAKQVIGFFEPSEENEARQMEGRNKNEAGLAVLSTIQEHDADVFKMLQALDKEYETHRDFEPKLANAARQRANELRATNLM